MKPLREGQTAAVGDADEANTAQQPPQLIHVTSFAFDVSRTHHFQSDEVLDQSTLVRRD